MWMGAMTVNYDEIRKENLRKYGEDVGRYGQILLAELYAERTHFIFELLQNAEDAGATQISFSLHSDWLQVTHDGRPFDDDDVKGICGLVEGTKASDSQKIGKFGIGFKSVYAYTRTPEVHSNGDHFIIRDYVRPFASDSRSVDPGLTLFLFPFDHPDIGTKQAYREIRARLENLGPEVLLFLESVSSINWEIRGGSRGSYERKAKTKNGLHFAYLTTSRPQSTADVAWLTFSRPLEEHDGLSVNLAFRLEANSNTRRLSVSPLDTSPLVAFLPTDKETKLGFLINGPYDTTPARDNIKDNSHNRRVVEETATLIVESLPVLRDAGYMDVNLLKALPTRAEEFPADSDFHKLFIAVRNCLRSEPVLPALDGSYVSADEAKLAREVAVRDLLDHSALRDLFGADSRVAWLTQEITIDRTPDLRLYVRDQLGIEELDGAGFARRVTGLFLEQRPDEWMTDFYIFLERREAMWRPGGPLREKPIIRLERGGHVPPYKSGRTPSAYIPPKHETTLPVVRRSVLSKPAARDFLKNLGYTVPDLVAEALEEVLPHYEKGSPPGDLASHLEDVRAIADALRSSSPNVAALLEKVRSTKCVLAVNAGDDRAEWQLPANTYLPRNDLKTYFEGNDEVWFISDGYPIELFDELLDMGVHKSVRVFARSPNAFGHVVLRSDFGDHERGLAHFDPQARIDGLKHALSNPSPTRCLFVWNEVLRPWARLIFGTVESSTKQDYAHSRREERPSTFGRMARQIKWLPVDSVYCAPNEVTLDELPDGFIRDEELAGRLGMKASSIKSLAEEVGIAYDILRLIQQNPDAAQRFAEELRAEQANVQLESNLNYAEALEARFATGEIAHEEGEEGVVTNQPIPDAALRKERTSKMIEKAKGAEPKMQDRFSIVDSRSWEGKNKSVRTFLINEYGGDCQICGAGFKKKNGQPYFEGLYLIPHTEARWVDRAGNVLCLCPTCSAKMLHGPLEAPDVLDQVSAAQVDGNGSSSPTIRVNLCGSETYIRFTARHMLDLQALIES
jgi:hypothetical protein